MELSTFPRGSVVYLTPPYFSSPHEPLVTSSRPARSLTLSSTYPYLQPLFGPVITPSRVIALLPSTQLESSDTHNSVPLRCPCSRPSCTLPLSSHSFQPFPRAAALARMEASFSSRRLEFVLMTVVLPLSAVFRLDLVCNSNR